MFSIKSQRGSSILVMMILVAGVTMATIAMFAKSQVNDASGQKFMARQRALYISDGTRAFTLQLLQDYLKNYPEANSEDITKYLNDNLPTLIPSGFEISDIQATLLSSTGAAVIPNGTFKGMNAPQTKVHFSYTLTSGSESEEGRIVHTFDAIVAVAQVGLHQFMYFIDLQSAGFSPGPVTTVNGRIHANGDLCVAGGHGLSLSKVSAAGHLYHSNRTACGVNQTKDPFYPLDKTWISSSSDLDDLVAFGLGDTNSTRNDSGCTQCAGTSQAWKEYAASTWNENAQDSAQGVPKLSLPVPDDVKAQVGANGIDPYVGYANNQNLRFLVDPVLTSDPDAVKKLKYAYLSDIRIIDGVWYIRDKSTWPGRPIWSDHPGNFTDAYGNKVGQAELASALGWTSIPKSFSYYSYDYSAQSLTGSTTGTISYGTLYRDVVGGKPSWRPGHPLGNKMSKGYGSTAAYAGGAYICPTPNPTSATPGTLNDAPTTNVMMPYDKILTCANGTNPTVATNLLNGTRSGFDDPHVAWAWEINYTYYPNPATDPTDRSHILPTNFDVDHFQKALRNTNPGELGSYFTQLGATTSFNGIVYITNTWPGSTDGFSPRGAPSPWPVQNDGFWPPNNTTTMTRFGDMSQLLPTVREMQRSLPMQLCTNSTSAMNVAAPGELFDKTPGATGYHFRIPDCANYPSGFTAYSNAIRIHNGREIDVDEFPTGLSIISNLPVYVLGGYNENSKASGDMTATPWIPALIAGDQITFMSDGWDDINDLMKIFYVKAPAPTTRTASDTTYNLSLISGWAMHRKYLTYASNEAVHALPALIEDWVGKTLELNGSIVIGYYPVFDRSGRYYYDNDSGGEGTSTLSSYNFFTYRAGTRKINFDKHLELISNQPPGSPTFYTSSTESWKIK